MAPSSRDSSKFHHRARDKPSRRYRGERRVPYFQRSATSLGNILHFTNTRSDKVAAMHRWVKLISSTSKSGLHDINDVLLSMP